MVGVHCPKHLYFQEHQPELAADCCLAERLAYRGIVRGDGALAYVARLGAMRLPAVFKLTRPRQFPPQLRAPYTASPTVPDLKTLAGLT